MPRPSYGHLLLNVLILAGPVVAALIAAILGFLSSAPINAPAACFLAAALLVALALVVSMARQTQAAGAAERRARSVLDATASIARDLEEMRSVLESPAESDGEEEAAGLRERIDRILARIEADLWTVREIALDETFELDLQPVDTGMGDYLERACEALEPLARGNGFEFHSRVDYPQARVTLDPGALRLALMVLVSRAIRRSTEVKTIRLAGTCQGEEYMISVRDSGLGIPPWELKGVFDRLAAPVDPEHPGAAPGLATVRTIVEAQGGSVDVQSSPPTGTTFTLRFPVIPGSAGPRTSPSAEEPEKDQGEG